MKLALVTETYPPEVNGVAMTLSRLVNGLRRRGHEVGIVRPTQAGERAGEAGADLLVRGMPLPFYRSLRMGLPASSVLRRRWTTNRPDLVHVATEGPLGLGALRAARQLGLPVSSSFHTNFHAYGGHYGLHLLRRPALAYLRWFHNRTRCTMVPAGDLRDRLSAQGFERLTVLSRGVDTELFSPAKRSDGLRAGWGAGPDTPVVVYVGRLAAEKNLELGVQAFLAIRQREPEARFVLVGDGPERAPLAERYPDFHYSGLRRGEDLAAHYASADVAVFPSITETFGNVVTEGLASGLVVLTYDYAAGREHVRDGVNGFAAPFDDAPAFVERARKLIAGRADWPRWRAQARETALGLTWDSIVDRFESELRTATAYARA